MVSQRLALDLRPRRTEPNGAVWANQFDNRRQPAGACRDDGAGDLATRRGGRRRRLRVRGRDRRDARRRRAGPAVAQARTSRIALADPMGSALFGHYTAGRAEILRLLRSRRGSARDASPANLEGPRGRAKPSSIHRRGGGADRLRPPAPRGPLPRRLVRPSTSRARSGSARSLGPGSHRSRRSYAIPALRYASKLFDPRPSSNRQGAAGAALAGWRAEADGTVTGACRRCSRDRCGTALRRA